MIRKLGGALIALILLALSVSVARAEDDPPLLAVGAGAYNFDHAAKEAMGRLEYRFPDRFFIFKPLMGVLATNKGSAYGYGGLRVDIYLWGKVVLMPVATVGAWGTADGKNLGAHIPEFKTGAELAWRFDDGSRIGLAADHISNAGITKHNPGVESLLLVYSIPID